jgi:hypothetical protein
VVNTRKSKELVTLGARRRQFSDSFLDNMNRISGGHVEKGAPVEEANLINHCLICVPVQSSQFGESGRILATYNYLRPVKIMLCKSGRTSCLSKDFVDPLSL